MRILAHREHFAGFTRLRSPLQAKTIVVSRQFSTQVYCGLQST